MILHILHRDQWNEAIRGGTLAPASLASEGFVHCSTASQVAQTANRFFRGQDKLVLLCLDEKRLKPEIRYESAHQELFPHVYGPINLDAVISVIDFPPNDDGTFNTPASLLE